MSLSNSSVNLLGGRLSIDFVNVAPTNAEFSWERLIRFLQSTGIVSTERGTHLLILPQSDPHRSHATKAKVGRRMD